MRVLYVSTEVYPFVKTGGLADVNAALPPALIDLNVDVRMLLPGLPGFMGAITNGERLASLDSAFGARKITIYRVNLNRTPAYLIDAPDFYDRPGTPYGDSNGNDWPDNPQRFALLGQIAARFAEGSFENWRPDIIHSHDWHAALAPAYSAARGGYRPASVFTIHNLSFQGQFPAETFTHLKLPSHFLAMQGLEFHGGVNFMKAGLFYADRLTTVSPSYASEIQTPEYGCGMEGVLSSRSGVLSGILNGIDRSVWNPRCNANLAAGYDVADISGKALCKQALSSELGLQCKPTELLFGVVSRLADQKGLDLLLGALPELLKHGGRVAVMGSGVPDIENKFLAAVKQYPQKIAVRIGYDEALAHRIIAGADVIIVPSRFEPCGLTQMYGLAYGTLPLVRRVGGLADTVRDANTANLASGTATGFVFDAALPEALVTAAIRAFALWRKPAVWGRLRETAMRQDFSWPSSARHYAELYTELRPRRAR